MFYSWFAVKRTLPRGGRYKLSRFYNLNGFEKFATVRLLQLPTCLSVATGKQGCRKGSLHGTLKLMSLYQMQEDADFDNAKVNLFVGYFVHHDVFYVVVISAASQR